MEATAGAPLGAAAVLGGLGLLALLGSSQRPARLRLGPASHVVVTGGSSGIGEAVAREAARRGAKVTLVARSREKLAQALGRIGAPESQARCEAADVTDETAVRAALGRAAEAFGPPDVLVCSAGLSEPGTFEDTDAATFEHVMRVNWLGTVLSVKAALPAMKANGGGRVVLVSSQAGQVGIFGFTAYSSSKFALRGFAESLAMEAKPHGVHVCLSFPPDTDTPLLASENEQKPKETKLISEASGVFSAQAVARDIVNGAERGDFFISTGLDGFMLSRLTCGMSPFTSGAQLVSEVLLMGVFRIVAAVYVFTWDRIIRAEHKRKLAGAS